MVGARAKSTEKFLSVVYYVSDSKAKSTDTSILSETHCPRCVCLHFCWFFLCLVQFMALSRLFGIDFVKIGETQVLDARD